MDERQQKLQEYLLLCVRDSKLTWYFRYSSYQQTVNKALREKRDKQSKQGKRRG